MFGIVEVIGEAHDNAKDKLGLPPGFRFHPTDEELIAFYLISKVFKPCEFHGVNIAEVDLNRCEPWELPDETKMGEREWYFFSLRVRKYPTGLRTNRATVAGYWKATGKDRQIYSSSNGVKLGTKKTLVFYKGGAPRGLKTKWVMHEYRLHSDLSSHTACKDEWVLCRIIHKSGEKIKPRSFQVQQTISLQEASPLSVPSPISLPPLSLGAAQTIDHNNIQFQTALQNLQRHENGLQSFIMSNPHFLLQSNLDTYLPLPPSSLQGTTGTDLLDHYNPALWIDAAGCGSREASSYSVDGGALVDVAAYAGGGCESGGNWSEGC